MGFSPTDSFSSFHFGRRWDARTRHVQSLCCGAVKCGRALIMIGFSGTHTERRFALEHKAALVHWKVWCACVVSPRGHACSMIPQDTSSLGLAVLCRAPEALAGAGVACTRTYARRHIIQVAMGGTPPARAVCGADAERHLPGRDSPVPHPSRKADLGVVRAKG